MQFIKTILTKLRAPVASENGGSGDDITDPESLAFYHTQAKFDSAPDRVIGFPRASTLYDGCMRQHVIACKSSNKVVIEQTNTPNDLIIFGLGTAVHYLVQNTPAFFGSRRIGFWECLACETTITFGKRPEKPCPKCGAGQKAIFYKEYNFKAASPLFCSGHVDLFISVKNEPHRLVEVKTMSETEYATLSAPKAKDEFQLHTYFILAEADKFLSGKVNTSRGYLFYVCKKVSRGSMPYKMFHVKRNPEIDKSIHEKLSSFRAGYEGYPNNIPTPLPACVQGNFNSHVSKACPVKTDCMNLLRKCL